MKCTTQLNFAACDFVFVYTINIAGSRAKVETDMNKHNNSIKK